MNKQQELEKFLTALGFERVEGDFLALTLDKGKDRFTTEVWLEGELFCFGKHFMRGFDYIPESELLENFNELSTSAKTHWLDLKNKIIEAGYEVRLMHE